MSGLNGVRLSLPLGCGSPLLLRFYNYPVGTHGKHSVTSQLKLYRLWVQSRGYVKETKLTGSLSNPSQKDTVVREEMESKGRVERFTGFTGKFMNPREKGGITEMTPWT